MDSPVTDVGPARLLPRPWPIRTGTAPPLADGFVARPDSVPALAEALVPGTIVMLADGTAGPARPASCGKTQLAVYLAEALWRAGQIELLAWVNAASRASVLSGYVQAAAAAGLDVAGPAGQVASRLASWLAQASQRWLVVLDDLRDATALEGLWPAGPAGRVVITGREHEPAAAQPAARIVPVPAFSTREALNYLMTRLSYDPDQRNGAIDLAITLSGEPAALAHASAVIATTTLTCRDYQRQVTARQPGSQPPSALTWAVSAHRAEQLCPGGAIPLVLALAALFDGQPIPGPLFTAAATRGRLAGEGATEADSDRAWEAASALERTGLLTIDRTLEPSLVWISRMTAAHARAALPRAVVDSAASTAANALLEIWPPDPQPALAEALRSCAASLLRTAASHLSTAKGPHPLLLHAGRSLDAARLTGPAARYWTQLTATTDKTHGPAHPATLTTGSYLAQALLADEQPGKAAAWWQWVATGRARQHGPDHADTVGARVSLGQALAAAARHAEAITVLEQAVTDSERARGPVHPGTLHGRDELAAACQAAGRAAEAIGHYQRALTDLERAHGPRHPSTISARTRLADACLRTGRLKESIACYKRALADRQHALGAGHLDTVQTQRDLAIACQAAGKITTALRLHEQACAGYEQLLGPDHPRTLAARADLASSYSTAGRLTDAATLLRDTLTRCEQTLPPGDALTQALRQSLTSLAGGYEQTSARYRPTDSRTPA